MQAILDSAAPAFKAVERYNEAIKDAAKRYGVPAAMLRTVMLREQEQINLADMLADQAVEWDIKEDSSTGVMQIFGRTAIRAINEALAAGTATLDSLGLTGVAPLDPDAEQDRDTVWRKLRGEPAFCIAVGALNLLSCARETVGRVDFERFTPEELVKTFARYNGFGEDARRYGEACLNLYSAFRRLFHDDELVDRE